MQHRDQLSDEERKARRLESARKYREANIDKAREAARVCQAKRRAESESVRLADKAGKQTATYKEQQRKYRAENREMLNKSTMDWRKANPEKYAEYQRQYQETHRAETRKRASEWRKNNPERLKDSSRIWRKENPDLNTLKSQRYRARKLQTGADLPKDTIKSLMVLQRGKCAVCKVSLAEAGRHLDHIMPLALGGLHSSENVQLLCPPCNLTKHAKHPVEFMQQKGFLL